jgi:hypothetical protein
MTAPQLISTDTMQSWLEELGTEFYLCNRCDGIHLRALQDTEGVIDSRLFLEEFGLLLSTELELRPSAVLAVTAELGRLNMDYPTLKIFLDMVDDALPQLVVAGNLPIGSHLTRDQFVHFIAMTVEATTHLAEACGQLEYLFSEDTAVDSAGGSVLH